LHESFGWYDMTVGVDSDASFQRQLAGHVEAGKPSMTDPAIAAPVPQATSAT
jgi:phospholipase C